jgi:RHS repeat-associated protein
VLFPTPEGVTARKPAAITVVACLCLLGSATAMSPGAASGGSSPAPGAGAESSAKTEAPSLRTRTSRTYLTPSGALLARVYNEPIHYKDSRDDWRPIDNELVATSHHRYAWRNAANAYALDLPSSLEDAPVRYRNGDAWVSFALEGAQADGAVSGATARYADALPGVDVAYTATSDRVKETLTLRDAGAPSTLRFRLDASDDLTPRLHPSGGVELVDDEGGRPISIEPPFMYPQRGGAAAASRDIRYALERAEGAWRLSLHADGEWLKRQLKDGPVVIDPTTTNGSLTTTYNASVECAYIRLTSNAQSSNCAGPQLVADNTGGAVKRPLLKFDVQSAVPAKATVLNAKLGLKGGYLEGAITAHVVTKPWTVDANWYRYNATASWANPGGDFHAVAAATGAFVQSDGWTYFAPTEVVQEWVSGLTPNHGLIFLSGIGHTLQYTSSQSSTNKPYLDVVYEQHMGMQRQHTFERQQLNDRMGAGVNVANGNLIVRASDVSIAGTGLDLGLDRTYNSLAGHDILDAGRAWRTSSEVNLSFFRDGSALVGMGDGAHYGFVRSVDAGGQESFLTPPGINATLTRETSPAQFRLRFNRTGQSFIFASGGGGVTKHEDQNGNAITFGYTGQNTTTITDTQGRTTTFDYMGGSFVRKITDPAGRTYEYTYGSNSNMTQFKDAAGGTTRYAYDAGNRLTDITDPRGVVTKVAYDSGGRVTSIKRDFRALTGQFAAETKFKYDGHTTTAPCTSPAGTDPFDNIVGKTVVTDARNNTTTYCYDWLGRVRKTRDARGNDRDTSYTSNSDVNEYTDGGVGSAGPLTSFSWSADGRNNLLGGQSPEGATFSVGYNNPNGTHPYYPSNGTDEQGNQTTISYDGDGNPTQVNNQGQTGVETTINWHNGANGRKGTIDSITDGNNHTTDYGYDTAGNLTSITPPSPLGQTKVTYEAPNNLGRIRTLEEGVVSNTAQHSETYDYDAMSRLDKITYSDGSLVDYDYDANGNMTRRADPSGITVFEYDNLNRLTKEILPFPLGTNEYTYDAVGNLLTVADAGGTTSYEYNAVNLNTKVTQPGNHATNLVYHAQRNFRTQTQYPNGVTVHATPDDANRVDLIDAKRAGTSFLKRDYQYQDANGTDRGVLQNVKDEADRTTTYSYDSLNRLDVAEQRNSGGTVVAKWDYGYDNVGNRMSENVHGTGTTTYSYNNANQLTSLTLPGGSARSFTYDAAGNELTNGNGRTLEYNVRDQTTGITPTSGGVKTILAYAGASQDDAVLEGSTTIQNNVLGLGIAGGTTPSYYTRDENGTLLGQRTTTLDRQYVVVDRLGSVLALTDTTGAVSKSYDYDPYGNTRSSSGTGSESRFRYAQGWLSAGGLYHFGARYYDPTVGRWTQRDPLDQTGDLTEGNPYTYVGADPVNAVDLSGTHRSFKNNHMVCDSQGCKHRQREFSECCPDGDGPWAAEIIFRGAQIACFGRTVKGAADLIKAVRKGGPRGPVTKAGAAAAAACAAVGAATVAGG